MNREAPFSFTSEDPKEMPQSKTGSFSGVAVSIEGTSPAGAAAPTNGNSGSALQAQPAAATTTVSRISKPTARPSSQPRQPKPGESQRDIYQEALRSLRGRYILATFLALLGAAGGVAAVIHFIRPVFKSEALLQIEFQRTTVINETDQNRPIAMFDAMLRAQIDIIRSRGLLEKALQTPLWQGFSSSSAPPTPQAVDDLANDLTVEHPNNTDHLRITKLDADPQVAAASINAVVEAYKVAYESREMSRELGRIEALEAEKARTEGEFSEIQTKLDEILQSVAGGDLEGRVDNASRRMTMLDTLLANVKIQQGLKEAHQTVIPATQQGVRNIQIDRIARNDPGMKGLANRKKQFTDELDNLVNGPNKLLDANPIVVEKRRQIEKLDREMQDYAAQLTDLTADIVEQIGGASATLPGGDLEAQDHVITQMKATLGKELANLIKTRTQVSQLKSSAARLDETVTRIAGRIRDLKVEASIGGRLKVISSGEVPLRPFYDPRRKLAMAGAMAGAGIPVALLVLLGLLSGKYRFVNETETDISRSAPLLGMLPSLPDRLRSMKQVADAAHSVHQIRAMLQMGEVGRSRSVYMVTSATAGEGKTNLTVALGLSFAAAGCKTLVVDCDLVGQGITRGFRAERTTGLREALDCGSARGFVKKLPQGLRLLTAGNADTLNGWTLSSAATGRMLSEVRRYYDIVLIDTGPILGSVEAAVLAPAVDGVILTVSRGQQRTLVDRAMQHLHALGAEPAGFVFNRAQSQDLKHTSYNSVNEKYSSLGGNLPEPRLEDTSEVAAFGPLVRSVATFMRVPSESDAD